MNLTSLSDNGLIAKTEDLVRSEREVLSEILHHLREIEQRRLFSKLGFKSLFDYATKRLGYAEDQAARRISAMRLLKELPEIEAKIQQGSLSLTNLAMAQTLFRREQKKQKVESKGFSQPTATERFSTKNAKIELLSTLENKSKREAEQIIAICAGESACLRSDRIKPLSESKISIFFVANRGLEHKIEKVKGLLAHSHPGLSMAGLVNYLCDEAIKKLDPAAQEVRKRNSIKEVDSFSRRSKLETPAPDIKRRIGISSRRQVWIQAGSRCQQCGSQDALQVDHILPKALGGSDGLENLRLLCRSCNQRAAVEWFGLAKMRKHLEEGKSL
ncbi:MAG: HNH endonuclease [Bdellovibrionales bacterium]